MHIDFYSFSDISGGAARASYRIFKSISDLSIDCSMYVVNALSDDKRIQVDCSKINILKSRINRYLAHLLTKTLVTSNSSLHSPAQFSTVKVNNINKSLADIVHLNWICGEMISIKDIGKISKPIVWTLHDMWPFCGAEHYSDNDRFVNGYTENNRPDEEKYFDLNKFVWRQKKKYWKYPIHIVGSTNWLATCAKTSSLLKEFPVSVIHYPIDTSSWCPHDKSICRKLYNFPNDAKIILFGAIGGTADPRKGFDLLFSALKFIKNKKNIHLVIFGQSGVENEENLEFPVHNVGHLYDDLSLIALYNAADVMVVPSRIEAFGQTALESESCGTPVVAFNICGFPDIIEHKVTGYLAKAFDPEDLAAGICWVLDHGEENNLSLNARNKVLKTFSSPLIAAQYVELYKKILNKPS